MIHRITKEVSGSGQYPTLTRTNYYDWTALIKVMLQARGLWEVVHVGATAGQDFTEGRMALEVISKAMPPGEVVTKPSAKVAWDALRTGHVGVERVRRAKANTLRREFDALRFRDGETIDDFCLRINGIVHKLAVLGMQISEEDIVRKFLQAMPQRNSQLAMSIETMLDLSQVSLEELIARLKAVEERHDLGGISGGGAAARLNHSKDELVARNAARLDCHTWF